MATKQEDYRLSYDERAQARLAGINQVIALEVGADPNKLTIVSAKNVKDVFRTATSGYMDIGVTWKDGNNFHWHSYRFNGENEAPLDENQLTVLGAIACARTTEVRDFSKFERRTAVIAEATVHELSFEPETTQPLQSTTEAA